MARQRWKPRDSLAGSNPRAKSDAFNKSEAGMYGSNGVRQMLSSLSWGDGRRQEMRFVLQIESRCCVAAPAFVIFGGNLFVDTFHAASCSPSLDVITQGSKRVYVNLFRLHSESI